MNYSYYVRVSRGAFYCLERLSSSQGRYQVKSIKEMSKNIQYSDTYKDDVYEYRHVILPPNIASRLETTKLLTEGEWRALGVQQSPGWEHYLWYEREPHILLFRRPRLVPRS